MTCVSEQIQSTLAFQRKVQQPVLTILKPLFDSLDITFFAHERMFNDGSKAFISSNVNVSEFWLHGQYPLDIILESGCYLGERLGSIFPAELRKLLGERFNIAHPLFIIKKYSTYTDAFMIATKSENYNIIHSYLTHIGKIKKFLSYYLNQCHRIIKQAELNKIQLIILPIIEASVNIIPDAPFNNTFSKSYFINEEIGFVSLTQRELTCIAQLIKGKSANETGILLNISKRTVETYLSKLKEKFRCSRTTELAYIIGKSNISFDLVSDRSHQK